MNFYKVHGAGPNKAAGEYNLWDSDDPIGFFYTYFGAPLKNEMHRALKQKILEANL